MKIKFFTYLFVLSTATLFAQGLKENQIRVVGTYRETINPKKFELNFLIKEVTSMSGGQKQVVKTVEDIKNETQKFLKSEKLADSDLVFNGLSGYNYANNGSNFSLTVNSIEKATKIIENTKIGGLSNVSMKYIYDITEDYNNALSEKALINAKSKAEFLASKVNKKIGKLLMIDDNTINKTSLYGVSGLLSSKDQTPDQEVQYSLYVTYELLDK